MGIFRVGIFQRGIFLELFFHYCIKEWNNLSEELRKIKSAVQFKTKVLTFIKPKENSFFKIHDINRIKAVKPCQIA